MEKTSLWLLPGAAFLGVFAWLLTLDPLASGRIYAAYGGVYIVCSVLWLWIGDGLPPDRWDWIGAAFCLVGASLMLLCACSTDWQRRKDKKRWR